MGNILFYSMNANGSQIINIPVSKTSCGCSQLQRFRADTARWTAQVISTSTILVISTIRRWFSLLYNSLAPNNRGCVSTTFQTSKAQEKISSVSWHPSYSKTPLLHALIYESPSSILTHSSIITVYISYLL